jgi:hypothetical protein
MPSVKTSKRKLSLAVEEVPSAHYLSVIWQHLTESLCEEVFAATRERERQRKWTLFALVWFWIARATRVAEEVLFLVAQSHDNDCRLTSWKDVSRLGVQPPMSLWATADCVRSRLKRPNNVPLRKRRNRSVRNDSGVCQLQGG